MITIWWLYYYQLPFSPSCPCSIPTLSFYSAIFRQNKASFYRWPSSSKLAMISTYCSLFPTIQPPTTSAGRSSVHNRIKRRAKNDSVLYMFNGTHLGDQEEVEEDKDTGWFMRKLNEVEFLFSVPYTLPCCWAFLSGTGVINIHSCTNLPSPGELFPYHNSNILPFYRKGNSINSLPHLYWSSSLCSTFSVNNSNWIDDMGNKYVLQRRLRRQWLNEKLSFQPPTINIWRHCGFMGTSILHSQ